MSYRLRIKENSKNFTKSDRKIADFLLQKPNEAVFLSAAELGDATETSQAAIIRFIKKINYKGLNELRIDMAKRQDDTPQPTMLIDKNASIGAIRATLTSLMCESAQSTQMLNDDRVFSEAIGRLLQAETIYLFGAGASGLVAEDLYNKLLRMNRRCIFDPKGDMQAMYAVHATPRDAYLAISYGGASKSVNTAAKQCGQNGAFGIAVTRAQVSALTKLADCVIKIPNCEQDVRVGALQSRYAQLLVTDILFMGLVQGQYEAVAQSLSKTRQAVKELNR